MSRKQAGTQQPIRENLQGSLPLKGNTASVTKAVKPRDDTDPGKDVNEPKPLAAGAPLHSQCRQACMEMPQSTWALRSRASRLSFCLPPSLHQKHVTLVNSYWATPFVSCQAVPFLPCTRPAFNSSSCDEPGPGSLGQAPPLSAESFPGKILPRSLQRRRRRRRRKRCCSADPFGAVVAPPPSIFQENNKTRYLSGYTRWSTGAARCVEDGEV